MDAISWNGLLTRLMSAVSCRILRGVREAVSVEPRADGQEGYICSNFKSFMIGLTHDKEDIVAKLDGVEEQWREWFSRQAMMVNNRAVYQRSYNRTWKQARRARLIVMLGGRCVHCGAAEDLEFDHIDPSAKVFAVCAGLSRAWDTLVEEASKTQLLCKPCHVAKGAEDRPELRHGTYHVYWYWNCRCDLCKAANARKSAALRAKKLARDSTGPSLAR